MAAPVPRADGTLKKKKRFRTIGNLGTHARYIQHAWSRKGQIYTVHATSADAYKGKFVPVLFIYIHLFHLIPRTGLMNSWNQVRLEHIIYPSIHLRIRLSIRDLPLAQSSSSLPLPTPPNKQTNPPTNLTTNCKLHHLGPWFVFVDISSFGINIDVMDHSTKWRLALNPINQWIPPLSARCDRVTCPTTTWPIVDTSCTSLDHHQHSYQLPRASDQLRAPRPIPSSLSDKYVQEQYTVYPLVSFGSRITTVHLFPQQRV